MGYPIWLQDLGLRVRITSPTLERALYAEFKQEVPSDLTAGDYALIQKLGAEWHDLLENGQPPPSDAAYALLLLKLARHSMAPMLIQARPTLVLPKAPESVRAYARHVQKIDPSNWWAQVVLRAVPVPTSRVHIRFSPEDAAWLDSRAAATKATPQDVVRALVTAARVGHAG